MKWERSIRGWPGRRCAGLMFPGSSEGRPAFSGHRGAAGSKALHLESLAGWRCDVLLGKGYRTSGKTSSSLLFGNCGLRLQGPSWAQLLREATWVMSLFTLEHFTFTTSGHWCSQVTWWFKMILNTLHLLGGDFCLLLVLYSKSTVI